MDPSLKQLQDLFQNALEVLVVTRERPSIDGICASLAISKAISSQRTLQGKDKKAIVAVSGRSGSQYSLLPGADQIVSELGLRDLVIGINGFTEGSIEHVNWYVDKGRLNVVFKSNPAVPMQFDLKNLDPFYAGANYDVVVVLDAAAPTDLGNAYKQDPGMYSELPIVNISNNPANTRFGKVNIVDPSVPSNCELCFQLLQVLSIPLNSDIATLLLIGIQDATDNLQRKGNQTDAIVAQLRSHGAREMNLDAVRQQSNQPPLPTAANSQVPNQGGYAPAATQNPQYQQYPPQYPPAYPGYPPNPYQQPPGYPPYGQQPPAYQQGYQYPPQQYPGQQYGGYPPAPQYPGYSQPQYPQAEYPAPDTNEESQPQEQNYEENTYEAPQEVPSLSHDQTPSQAYVPTSDALGYGHVEPSIYMPNIPQNQYYQQSYEQSPDQFAQNTQVPVENKESKPDPDLNKPPQVFNPGREGNK